MKSLEALKKALEENETVKQFKILEHAIFNNDTYKQEYASLLEAQQRMVNAKEKNLANHAALKREYEAKMEKMIENPLISQYLSLQETLNEDVGMLFSIIESGVNNGLDRK